MRISDWSSDVCSSDLRTRIYATDISAHALEISREGIYASREMQNWAANYLQAGGQATLSDYFHARYGHIKLDESLRRNVVFSTHNLVADAVFCEVQLILCRNVLIYFRQPLQQRAITRPEERRVGKGCDSQGKNR